MAAILLLSMHAILVLHEGDSKAASVDNDETETGVLVLCDWFTSTLSLPFSFSLAHDFTIYAHEKFES